MGAQNINDIYRAIGIFSIALAPTSKLSKSLFHVGSAIRTSKDVSLQLALLIAPVYVVSGVQASEHPDDGPLSANDDHGHASIF